MFVHLNEQELFIKRDLLGVPKAQNTDNGDQFATQGLWLELFSATRTTGQPPALTIFYVVATERSGFMISGNGQFFFFLLSATL